ncbi:response regulator [Dyadobacter arcticus]|uniref:CheY-like chemotaxis protein n=1 Tax=Dyadobacter arcticus TaxID=1078754 RepID=A0ABX0UUU7_9BACT|nr:response regulator [Dyadobacter arcticus]NIJ55659.1 CheY-like chemotaxis protein [Dyadobacter arcticus]
MNTLERLCVVDDDPVFTFLLKKIIEKTQVTLETVFFENGQEAIDYLLECNFQQQKLPELILLDINMPILDGWQFIDEYAKIHPSLSKGISIFMVSSSTENEDYERAMSTGFITDYVHKPIYATELQQIVNKVLSLN